MAACQATLPTRPTERTTGAGSGTFRLSVPSCPPRFSERKDRELAEFDRVRREFSSRTGIPFIGDSSDAAVALLKADRRPFLSSQAVEDERDGLGVVAAGDVEETRSGIASPKEDDLVSSRNERGSRLADRPSSGSGSIGPGWICECGTANPAAAESCSRCYLTEQFVQRKAQARKHEDEKPGDSAE